MSGDPAVTWMPTQDNYGAIAATPAAQDVLAVMATSPLTASMEALPLAQAVALPVRGALSPEEQQKINTSGSTYRDDSRSASANNACKDFFMARHGILLLPCCLVLMIAVYFTIVFFLEQNHDATLASITAAPKTNPSTVPLTMAPVLLPTSPPTKFPLEHIKIDNNIDGTVLNNNNNNNNNNNTVVASLDMPRQGPLMDLIHLIPPHESDLIVEEIRQSQHDVLGSDIQVLLVNAVPSESTKSFATSLFTTWRLGSEPTNQGVLILFVMNARRIEVEVGASLDHYMTQAWTTSMLRRRAVPAFQKGHYGFGIYNVVVAIADRLRDIDNGVVTPEPIDGRTDQGGNDKTNNQQQQQQEQQQQQQQPSFVLAILGVLGIPVMCCIGCAQLDSHLYPMGRGRACSQCGRDDQWAHVRWETVYPATYASAGLQRRHCVCQHCRSHDYKEESLPPLTRQESVRSGYDIPGDTGGGSSSGSGGGGHSSGNAGGGAAW